MVLKVFIFLTLLIVLLVELDKKLMFHNIMAMEYIMKNKNYTSTDYILRTSIIMVFFVLGLLICFIQSVFKMFSANQDQDIYRVILSNSIQIHLMTVGVGFQ